MVRGRTTASEGLVLGHEITGEVIEVGPDVEFIKKGDLVSVPFNIACGHCRSCKEQHTHICENVKPDCPASAYGYVDMGGWVGGQSEYVMVPTAELYGLNTTNNGRLVVFGGGIPLELDGKVVGAIEVSGSSVPNDVKVAEASTKLFNNKFSK
jgi:threonine dehydrogenase-like Zn-dependent dehydrogenase